MAENFSRVLAIPLKITVVLNKTRMILKDIFDLIKGSLIELDTFARKIAN